MQTNALESVSLTLQALQDAVLAHPADTEDSSIRQQLKHLSACVQNILKRQVELEKSLEDRSIAQRALRNVLAIKEAEVAHLHSETFRLRHMLQLEQTAEVTAHGVQDQQDAEAAIKGGTVLGTAGQQALLEAAVTAKQKPVAVLLQLESEVSTCKERISSLESELAAAAAEHASRMSEQQKGFLSKLEQLRQVHSQQLAAAVADATSAAREQQQQQQLQHEQHVIQLHAQFKQQQEQQQVLIESLEKQLKQLHIQQQTAVQPAAPVVANHSQTTRETVVPGGQISGTLGDVVHGQYTLVAASMDSVVAAAAAGGLQAVATTDKGAAIAAVELEATPAAADAATLQLMEGQLIRLSGTIKAHQEEIKQLRQALLEGADERWQLQQQLQQATEKQQQPAPAPVKADKKPADTAASSSSKRVSGNGHTMKPSAPGMFRSSSSRQTRVGH